MYDFVIGGAASGKTSYIYDRIVRESLLHPDREYFLFVPEQYTLMAQQELCRRSERGGMLNVDVLSFRLLTYRVFSELGIKKPDVLDDMTKSLLLRKAMGMKKNELKLYSKKVSSRGFISELRQAIAEFCQYDIDVEKLRELSESTASRRLSAKLSDIGLIYETFNSLLGEGAVIPEELPRLLLRYLPASSYLSGGEVYFDGFTGFTPIQLKIIAHILSRADNVSFAVTIPWEELRLGASAASSCRHDTDIFWMSRDMISSIGELADREGILHGRDTIMEGCKLEPRLCVRTAKDPYKEVHELARAVKSSLMRKNGSLRYSELAVAVSDMETYRELIKNEFDRAGIPCFLDENTGAEQSAAAMLLRAALKVIAKGYRYEDLSRYIKNPILRIYSGELEPYSDIFDNYIRARGLRGRSACEAELKNTYRGAEQLNIPALETYRKRLLLPLFRLHDRIREEGDIKGYVEALRLYTEEIGLSECDDQLCSEMEELGFINEAANERSLRELCFTLLDRMSELLGAETAKLRDFSELFDAGVAALKTGSIPQSMDTVVVGDLRRSRFGTVKELYILGANDGYIPRSGDVPGIFTRRERDELQALGIELAPQSVRLISSENFYLYLLLHKPQKRLCISWPEEDRKGGSLRPAQFISALEMEVSEPDAAVEGFFVSPEDALLSLSEKLSEGRTIDDSTLDLYSILCRRRDTRDRCQRLIKGMGFKHTEDIISPETAAGLYGDRLYGTVTRIEDYERCAYAHFIRHGLRLRERQKYDVEASDIGNLYHAALELVFRRLDERGLDLSEVSGSELCAIGDEAVREVIEGYNDSIIQSSKRNMFLGDRVSKVTARSLWALSLQAKKGAFRTFGCEIPFYIKEDGIELHGRIDRVDTCRCSSGTYVRVIDYKTGKARFDLSLIYHGLQLQLITYMDAALHEVGRRYAEAPRPAGLYYYNIDDPLVPYSDVGCGSDMKEKTEKAILSDLRMSGLSNCEEGVLKYLDGELSDTATVTSDVIPVRLRSGQVVSGMATACGTEGFKQLMDHTMERIRRDTKEIMKGRVDIRPYRYGGRTGCDHCPYHGICGFDTRLPGFSYKNLSAVSEDRLRKELFSSTDSGSKDRMTEEKQ